MSFEAVNSNEPGLFVNRLLAVDDSFESAELVARIASGCGYETKPIMDPRCVPQILEDWKPDVLTLDLCMPHKDGISTLATLKAVGFQGHLIIITAQKSFLRKTAKQLA